MSSKLSLRVATTLLVLMLSSSAYGFVQCPNPYGPGWEYIGVRGTNLVHTNTFLTDPGTWETYLRSIEHPYAWIWRPTVTKETRRWWQIVIALLFGWEVEEIEGYEFQIELPLEPHEVGIVERKYSESVYEYTYDVQCLWYHPGLQQYTYTTKATGLSTSSTVRSTDFRAYSKPGGSL